jgi:hypothetical protein
MIDGFWIGIFIGLATGWAIWYNVGWNAHVEFKRTGDYSKADDTAKKERKGIL